MILVSRIRGQRNRLQMISMTCATKASLEAYP